MKCLLDKGEELLSRDKVSPYDVERFLDELEKPLYANRNLVGLIEQAETKEEVEVYIEAIECNCLSLCGECDFVREGIREGYKDFDRIKDKCIALGCV